MTKESTIGERFKQLRIEHKKTQDEWGELCGGVGKATVSLYENDELVPPTERLLALRASGVDFSMDWLLFGAAPSMGDTREQALMQLYRSSDERGKTTILRAAEQESQFNVEPGSEQQKTA